MDRVTTDAPAAPSERPRRRTLEVLEVRDPCRESWDAMRGDDKVRFCGLCERSVYHLSNMTRAEAEQVLAGFDRVCVRFYRRADGTVSTIDCEPVRFAALRKQARRGLAAAASMVVSLLGVVCSLSLFRLLGLDVSTWFADTPVAEVAKAVEPVFEPPMTEEVYRARPMRHPEPPEPMPPLGPMYMGDPY